MTAYTTYTSNGTLTVLSIREDGRKYRAVFNRNGAAVVSTFVPTANRWVAIAYGKGGLKRAKEMLAEAEASFAA